ncbi:MAG TPA: methyltransferase domain-containing protein [bacterium]|nr:methyltransferase domain-containing protein [bacterium]
MSPEVYQALEAILKKAGPIRSLLEVGAAPGPLNLLEMECLKGVREKIGIHLEKAARGKGWKILKGNAHDLGRFPRGRFEAVVSNSTLEHDPQFWRTLSEIKRVTAPGGLVLLGVPGFSGMGLRALAPESPWLRRWLRLGAWWGGDKSLASGALTLGEHFFPGDYYRFTEQAMREVLLEGLGDIRVLKLMSPPRFIGWGRKK